MKPSHSLPPGHSLVETLDGSITFYSEQFGEACHSSAGAKSETILHYLEGCKIKEKTKLHTPLVILEIGFGLGLGLLTTLEQVDSDACIHFISVEIDKNLLDWFVSLHPEFNWTWNNNILQANLGKHLITVIQGNARKTLPEFIENSSLKWHAIYQDAFSPKRNPVLWTKEWFSFLKDHSHPDVILSTYSASSSIRKSLHETGWGVLKGERFGQKRASTRAVLTLPTDNEILDQLNRSPAKALTDETIEIPL